ncbi:MAG: hypothetical protein M3P94_07245 [Chloroflexota bacterium]|nr:hypothetical protein [Chloroflexota bacterium]
MDTTEPTSPVSQRRRTGTPVGPTVMIDGHEWHLFPAGLAPIVAAERDRLYDDWVVKQSVQMEDIRLVAYYALHTNYYLSEADVARLVWVANPDELVAATMESLFPTAYRRTWSAWARSALLANGLKPESIAGEDLPHVLAQLVQTGRAVACEVYTEADEAMAARRGFLEFGKDS